MESSSATALSDAGVVEAPDTTFDEIPVTNSLNETSSALAQDASMNPVVSLDKLVESTINTSSVNVSEPMEESVAKVQQEPESVQPLRVNGAPQKPKQKANAFSLGVPGLDFSPESVKTASDGTKMVQIHQSQISPEQLIALQNNPNIKVVFRHVPSGKSYSKTPRHMLPPGYTGPARKRKAQYPVEEVQSTDVYSFDEGDDIGEGPAKMMKAMENRARYSYGEYGLMKKKSGKSRLATDPGTYTSTYTKTNKQQSLPAKVILTDLLARVNHPNAKKEVRLHTSQINAEVLANMDLNPMFKIVLTTKQELPPLVVETVTQEEKAKLEKDAEEVEKQVEEEEKVTEESKEESKPDEVMEEENATEPEEQDQADNVEEPGQEEDDEERRLAEEKERKLKEKEREKKLKADDEDLLKTVMQTSRSGRIRKPSRFSLDIARLTKRKSTGVSGDESSTDDTEQDASKIKSPNDASKKSKLAEPEADSTPTRQKETRSSEEATPEPTPTRRGRGRPRKNAAPKDSEQEQKETKSDSKKDSKEQEEEKKNEEKTAISENDKTEKVESKISEVPTEDEKKIDESDEKNTNSEDKTDEAVSESEKEVTSTENIETSKAEKDTVEKTENDSVEKEAESVVSAEPDTSTDAVKSTNDTKSEEKKEEEDEEKMDLDEPLSLKIDEEEEKEVIDNKYRLRKLLEQCSADEIRSVMLPEAFDSINIGDFLLYKSAQTHNTNDKISFPQLYKQFEMLHKDATKEATRYNVLVRRANKVGGDKRMEKIVLMPVYNIEAANSLEISNSSIDAHICGIQRPMTTQMIAANSFFIRAKMDSPNIRLKLPETTAQKFHRPRQRRPLYSNQHTQKYMTNQQQEPDSTTPDKPKTQNRRISYERKMPTMKHTILPTPFESRQNVRKPAYLEQLKATGQIPTQQKNNNLSSQRLQNIPIIDDSNIIKSNTQSLQISSASSTLAQFQAAVDQQQSVVTAAGNVTTSDASSLVLSTTGELVSTTDTTLAASAPSDTTPGEEQFFVTEDGVPVSQASTVEDGDVKKHLVPIGDGQYVELPEGYSLIQTDEGYIIGQPGSTFTQGEDGNVYVTNSDGTTTEITEENVVAEGEAVSVVDQVSEG